MRERNLFSGLILAGFLIIYAYLLAVPINLATADLGRHIKNGELILNGTLGVLYTNFYSYTYPDFPFVNHHWLGGVVFYLTNLIGSFELTQLVFILISLASFSIVFYTSKKYSNIYISSIIALITIPVLAYRYEIRPEVFSYLFVSIYYLILKGFLRGETKNKWLLLLPAIQILWVNTHIYFFAGFLIIGAFWIQSLIEWSLSKDKLAFKYLKELTGIGFICALVSLLNPHFLYGLIYPFQILGNYGYRVLENQSIFFLEGIINVPVVLYFKILLGVFFFSWIYKIYRTIRFKEGMSVADLIISIGFTYLALNQIRNIALFGFFAIPIITANLRSIKFEMSRYILFPALGVLLLFLLMINPVYWEERAFGIGLLPKMEGAAEFFKREKITGPVFNNYDIGGYLIYYLNPGEKVFVDNRPEGYPAEFFTKIYVPMQEDNTIWTAKLAEYNFNSIFFYRLDLTPWAQSFLLARIKDPEWAPVFVDDYNIIFLKRNDVNRELINKYELPKEMFSTK